MPVESGAAFLLKLSDGGSPETFRTLAGLRTTQVQINAQPVVVTHKGSGGWRELLGGAGVRSVSISGAGVFTGSAAEMQLKARALAGALDRFEVTFEGGERLRGRFLVTRLDYAGDFNGERTYALTLESSGPVEAL
ncbi:MAG: phage tail protein [Sphingomonadaceae bacterium]|uniref:phage tail protein n=1 Tax=Thermaurantiacus sp. TaxID=2820283 RepID=UPI00298EEB26|nr:phage tail protein [Thermaurantiacus sp.]MCS6987768.1 phage tail protein [Sphingomonadaceae bacterium]MDW8415011.1 phage tail protein [Thermaurantiacus sp.]